MFYTDEQGTEIELPKLTMALNEELDAAKTFATQYAFLKRVLPSDYLVEKLDGETLDEIDISALSAISVGVAEAYRRPMRDAQEAVLAAQLESFEKIAKLSDTVSKIAAMNNNKSRQVFR